MQVVKLSAYQNDRPLVAEVMADVEFDLAIHPAIAGWGWVVTHAPSGYGICNTDNATHARAARRELLALTVDWRKPHGHWFDADEIKAIRGALAILSLRGTIINNKEATHGEL